MISYTADGKVDRAATAPEVTDWVQFAIEASDALDDANAKIAALRTRLEIPEPPFEHIDGIECRDETIRLHDIGVAEMKVEIAALRECVKAADAMRYVLDGPVGRSDGITESTFICCREYDAARAKVPL